MEAGSCGVLPGLGQSPGPYALRAWFSSGASLRRLAAQVPGLRELHVHGEEYRVILPDGSVRWLYGKGSAGRDASGRDLNALTAMGVIGGCTDTNEINYLLVKAFRAGLGVVPIEQQSRI